MLEFYNNIQTRVFSCQMEDELQVRYNVNCSKITLHLELETLKEQVLAGVIDIVQVSVKEAGSIAIMTFREIRRWVEQVMTEKHVPMVTLVATLLADTGETNDNDHERAIYLNRVKTNDQPDNYPWLTPVRTRMISAAFPLTQKFIGHRNESFRAVIVDQMMRSVETYNYNGPQNRWLNIEEKQIVANRDVKVLIAENEEFQPYWYIRENKMPAVALLFYNRYGVLDQILVYGNLQEIVEHSNDVAKVGDMNVIYNEEDKQKWQVTSEPVCSDELPLWRDFAAAGTAWVQMPLQAFEENDNEVIISNVKYEASDKGNDFVTFSFEFAFADNKRREL